MEEGNGLLVGSVNICPWISQFEIPHHTPADVSSLNGLRAWVEDHSLCCDIAFLVILMEEALGDKQYGISMVWVDPSQTRVTSMEEAVTRLTTDTSNRAYWPYALVQLYKGT